ncbi:MAG: hypothetical protein ACYDCQ_09330 [Dehalococcoidia bacterium]
MTREARPIDATDMPDVSRLVQEVNRTGRPRLLQVGGKSARLSPARAKRRVSTPSKVDIDASISAAGSWTGLVDADQLKRDLDEARGSESSSLTL